MQKKWLAKENNRHCILFFNGWGMDEHAIAGINHTGFDLCMFNNYQSLHINEDDFCGYEKLHLVAWSLGAWAAAICLEKSTLKFEKSIAINGTLQPVDNNMGIPTRIFQLTLDTWNERNRIKFDRRVFGGNEAYAELSACHAKRSIDEQKKELSFLLQEIQAQPVPVFRYKHALIGTADLIFSAKNQHNAWQTQTAISEKNWPHFPFAAFTSWKELFGMQE